MKRLMLGALGALVLAAMAAPAAANIDIVFDYSYDTLGFFTAQERKDRLEAAGAYYEAMLTDDLAAIVPGGGNSWTPRFFHPATGAWFDGPTDLVVPENQVRIYAGGRDMGSLGMGGPGGYAASGTTQDWFDLVDARGETGALTSSPTDFGPWGGAVAFDTNPAYAWYFGASEAALGALEADFLTVALHELGHLFGFGTADSWTACVSGDYFTGAAATAEYGSAPPLADDAAHWAEGTQAQAYPDGALTDVAMDPSSWVGRRTLLTDLDWAALDDVGWSLAPEPATLALVALGAAVVAARRRREG